MERYGRKKNGSDTENYLNTYKNKNCNLLFCIAYSHYLSKYIHRVTYRQKQFNIYWVRVLIYYYAFNNLSRLLNIDMAETNGLGIHSCDLTDREFNCSNPYKDNIECVYKDKYQGKKSMR